MCHVQVMELELREVLDCHAYLFFYTRAPRPPPVAQAGGAVESPRGANLTDESCGVGVDDDEDVRKALEGGMEVEVVGAAVEGASCPGTKGAGREDVEEEKTKSAEGAGEEEARSTNERAASPFEFRGRGGCSPRWPRVPPRTSSKRSLSFAATRARQVHA